MVSNDGGRILSVRVRHPTEDRDVEIRLDDETYSEVDAVFNTVYGVETLLIPFYEQVEHDSDKVAELLKLIEKRRLGPIVIALHKRTTSFMLPKIDWKDPSPIQILGKGGGEWY
jgi:hypothetical protein